MKNLVVVLALLASCSAATSDAPANRAIDLVTTAAPSATCHDWGRHVGSADIDYAWCGVQGVWQICAVTGVEQACKVVIDPRPKTGPAPATPSPSAPAPAPPKVAPVSSGSGAGNSPHE